VNIIGSDKTHPWAGSSGRWFPQAYRRMRSIFKDAGAANAAFGLHFLVGNQPPFEMFNLEDSDFDWIGFTVNDYAFSVSPLIYEGYRWARANHPTKPIALFEYTLLRQDSRASTLDNHLNLIKKLPAIKLIQICEFVSVKSWGSLKYRSSALTEESVKILAKRVNDPYYVWQKDS